MFRDRRRTLHLATVAKQERTTLARACSYAQWVPASEVVVAQSRSNLLVWYRCGGSTRSGWLLSRLPRSCACMAVTAIPLGLRVPLLHFVEAAWRKLDAIVSFSYKTHVASGYFRLMGSRLHRQWWRWLRVRLARWIWAPQLCAVGAWWYSLLAV